jgi:hypothetical protein
MENTKPLNDIIADIDSLFPADSQYPNTQATGQHLLEMAKRNVGYYDDWRNLPENVIREYHGLCVWENNRQEKAMMRDDKIKY